ncbi:MAG: hypothetical protein EBY03_07395, partial [Actinobacteria bacterium]|nr:hypothetical protein [Actinomycetota bacterium]
MAPEISEKYIFKRRAVVGALLILFIPYIGSSLAATITISGRSAGGAVEFAQGSQVTVVCDTTILTSLDEQWYETTTVFRVATINVTGILNTDSQTATTNNAGCGGKTMTVKLFASGTQQRLGTSASTETFVSFTVPTSAGAVSTTGATGVTAVATVSGSPATNTDIAITIPMNSATIINATTVDR